MTVLEIVGLLVLLVGVLWDLFSLYLYLAINIKGHGASGVPVVSWFIYVTYFAAAAATETVSSWLAIRLVALLTIFHALCHYVIPVQHSKFLKNRKSTGAPV